MANLRHGVVSPRRLRWRLVPKSFRNSSPRPLAGEGGPRSGPGEGANAKGKLGPGDPPTYYTYDALDNLIEVQQQGGSTDSSQWRTRTFVYDSLSRLISATNPESGATNYIYDADGNLASKTDARGITPTYSYDALNRLTGKTYSNGDPAVSYTYDQGANGVGRRTGMTDAAGSETWTYDPMGRVLTDQRKTNGVTKAVSYSYNLDGTLKSLTYPSGRVVNYQVGGAELPLSAVDSGSGTNYVSGATYAPQGALAAMVLGGNINLSESYSSRLQPSTIRAVAASGTDLLDLAYDFGLGTADNGDVKAIVNNRDTTRTQYFDYDALNRIDLANTQASTGANAWGQAFGYDPWGNLTSVTVTQGAAPSLSVGVNANNQLAGAPYSYDAAGDMLTDALNTYTWNAEGKMATVSSPQGLVTYPYDGDGRRVEKSSGKLYWYGSAGNVLAESDLSGNITDEYIFFGGKRIARVDSSGNVDYYLSDSLGSSRVVTDSNGNILDDCDFLPFGDEQCVASSSGNNYKFDGMERDSESQLDHTLNRQYSSTYDRWLSADPRNAGANLNNPQSWNAYAFTQDNPTTDTDPTGLGPCFEDSEGGWHGGAGCWDAAASQPAQDQADPGQTLSGTAHNQWSLSWQVNASVAFFAGELQGVEDVTVTPVLNTVEHPVDTVEGMAHAVERPVDTARKIANGAVDTVKAAANGNPRAIGQVVGTVAAAAYAAQGVRIYKSIPEGGPGGAGIHMPLTDRTYIRADVHRLHLEGRGATKLVPHIDLKIGSWEVKHFPWTTQ